MNAILTLAWKELMLLWRDKFALFWILAFPLMFALFFGSVFGGPGGEGRGALSLVLVDEDQSDASASLAARLAGHSSIAVARNPDGAGLEVLSLAEARQVVQKGRRAAYLRIPNGYGANPYALFGGGGEGQDPIEIGIDPGRSAEAGFLQGVLMESLFGVIQERILDKDAVRHDLTQVRAEIAESDLSMGQKLVLQTFFGALSTFLEQLDVDTLRPARAATPDLLPGETPAAEPSSPFGLSGAVKVVDVSRDRSGLPRTSWDITFPQGLVWGLMSIAMSFAITLVRERTAGTLLRLRMAPVSRRHLLAGKALGCYLACLVTMALLLAFGVFALGVRVDSFPLLLVAMLCISACFTGLMLTISVMGKTEAAVAGGAWGLLMPLVMIGGGMIPIIAMPGWLVSISVISPFKWAITAVEGAVWRGFGPADMLVPGLVLVGTGVGFFVLGLTIFRKVEG